MVRKGKAQDVAAIHKMMWAARDDIGITNPEFAHKGRSEIEGWCDAGKVWVDERDG